MSPPLAIRGLYLRLPNKILRLSTYMGLAIAAALPSTSTSVSNRRSISSSCPTFALQGINATSNNPINYSVVNTIQNGFYTGIGLVAQVLSGATSFSLNTAGNLYGNGLVATADSARSSGFYFGAPGTSDYPPVVCSNNNGQLACTDGNGYHLTWMACDAPGYGQYIYNAADGISIYCTPATLQIVANC